jgi:hypothetical protein
MAMTRDESLRLFNQEIKKTIDEIGAVDEERMKLRLMMLSNPIIFDGRLEDLRFRKIVLEDRLKMFSESRDRLLEAMMEECL